MLARLTDADTYRPRPRDEGMELTGMESTQESPEKHVLLDPRLAFVHNTKS